MKCSCFRDMTREKAVDKEARKLANPTCISPIDRLSRLAEGPEGRIILHRTTFSARTLHNCLVSMTILSIASKHWHPPVPAPDQTRPDPYIAYKNHALPSPPSLLSFNTQHPPHHHSQPNSQEKFRQIQYEVRHPYRSRCPRYGRRCSGRRRHFRQPYSFNP